MTVWKQIALWSMGMLLAVFGGCALLVYSLPDDMCATTTIDQIPSPGGTLKAVVFQIDCGATTDFNSHVAIVAADTDLSKQDSLPQSFFAADGNHGLAPSGREGGPEVLIAWKDERHLEVQHHALVRLIRAEKKSNGVSINYTPFR